MTSCPTCSLPAPESRRHCAFCATPLASQPMLARLEWAAGDHLRFVSGDRTLAEVHWSDGLWRLKGPGDISLVMVPVVDEDGTEVTFFDSELNTVAGVRTLSIDAGSSVVLCDAEDQVVAIVRTDGSGGLHAAGNDGNALLFAGRNGWDLDLLITGAGQARSMVLVCALLAALETECIGPLHSAPESA